MSNVIVFGSLNMDLSIETERMPLAGETIVGHGFLMNPGGKGVNQAVAAARMDVPVYLVGAAGVDTFGDQIIAELATSNVHCDYISRTRECSTGIAVITRTEGDNRIILDSGANHALSIEDVRSTLDQLAHEGDVFLCELECDYQTTLAALELAHERGLYTVFNPAPARALPNEIWAHVDLVCINETECQIITGILPTDDESLQRAMGSLAKLGAKTVVVTLGAAGSAAFFDDKLVRVSGRKVNAIDTTCAGDTYIGALAAAKAQGMEFSAAMDWATAMSALTTTCLGAQQSIPLASDVKRLLGE